MKLFIYLLGKKALFFYFYSFNHFLLIKISFRTKIFINKKCDSNKK
jgi:hypothetical protein